MKGAATGMILIIIAAIVATAFVYNYYTPEKSVSPTGRAVTGSTTDSSRLGFLESCNPNRDKCDVGFVCKLARDNIYRCLTTS